MARRWMIVSAAGVLVVAAVLVTAFSGASGGRRTHRTAGRATVAPAPTATPSLTPTPAPRPRRTAKRHHAVTARASAASRRRPARSTTRGSGGGQADPCAHNHHCGVPPMPPVKPDPRPPAPLPTVTAEPPTGN